MFASGHESLDTELDCVVRGLLAACALLLPCGGMWVRICIWPVGMDFWTLLDCVVGRGRCCWHARCAACMYGMWHAIARRALLYGAHKLYDDIIIYVCACCCLLRCTGHRAQGIGRAGAWPAARVRSVRARPGRSLLKME